MSQQQWCSSVGLHQDAAELCLHANLFVMTDIISVFTMLTTSVYQNTNVSKWAQTHRLYKTTDTISVHIYEESFWGSIMEAPISPFWQRLIPKLILLSNGLALALCELPLS